MTTRRGSRPSCAACRFHRVRCRIDCQLAPYFPASEPEVFQNVHRLYSVSRITEILNLLNHNDLAKQEAMTSIKYECYIRQIYPVHGCYGFTVSLHQNVNRLMSELQQVLHLLDWYRRNNNQQIIHDSQIIPSFGSDLPVNNEIINDQSVVGLSNTPNDQSIFENNQGFHFAGPSDHNAINEAASSGMESPSKYLDYQDSRDNEE